MLVDNKTPISCSFSSVDQLLEWHYRLGHISCYTMKYLDFLKHIPEKPDLIRQCEACHKAKQQRNPFPTSNIHTQTIFELIHVDLWGPYRQFSLTNTPYMLTIVDDFSRSTWTFLLAHKTQVAKTLDNFIRMVQTQFDKKVKCIRTDNGTKFLSTECQNIFQTFGIIHHKTCVYTPQQNGVVERKHKHLLQIARSLMFHANLPLKFWTYSLLMATFIINRLPTPVFQWLTPFEKLFGHKPDYTLIRTFGSLCYIANTKPHKTKFESRAHKCIFLGYNPGQKRF